MGVLVVFDDLNYARVRAGSLGVALRRGHTAGVLPGIGGVWAYRGGRFEVSHPPPGRTALAALLFGPAPAAPALSYPVALLAPAAAPHKPRRWFGCPLCGRKCSDLYLKTPQPRLACRLCHGLTYRSRTTSKADRDRLRQLRARLGIG